MTKSLTLKAPIQTSMSLDNIIKYVGSAKTINTAKKENKVYFYLSETELDNQRGEGTFNKLTDCSTIISPLSGNSLKDYSSRKAAYKDIKKAFQNAGLKAPAEQVKAYNVYECVEYPFIRIRKNKFENKWNIQKIFIVSHADKLSKQIDEIYENNFHLVKFNTRSEALEAIKVCFSPLSNYDFSSLVLSDFASLA